MYVIFSADLGFTSAGNTATSSKGSSMVACSNPLLQEGLMLHPVEGIMVHLLPNEEAGLINVA